MNDPDLDAIEAYITRTGCTASGLSTASVGYPGLISMLRASQPVSRAKRNRVLAYMQEHPDGPPVRRRKTQIDRTNSRYGEGEQKSSGGQSTAVPVPALHTLTRPEWVRKAAFKRRVPIVELLAELVELGIRAYEKEHPDAVD